MKTIEKRSIAVSELRAAAEGDEPSISGYAATFNILSADLGGFREVIAPGAFKNALASGADIKCLFNHDSNRILGRSSAGTLEVAEDSRGLKFTCTLDPENTDHANLRASILRGDIKECSFAFTVADGGERWEQAIDETGATFVRRTLLAVNLMDVSAVTYPAYSAPGATEVSARTAFLKTDTGSAAQRARLEELIADSVRRSRAHELGLQILGSLFPKSEARGSKGFVASKAAEACGAMGLDYCSHDENHIFASDPEDESESNCLRYGYDLDEEGNVTLDEDSEESCSHEITHSARAAKRQRAADRELRNRMQAHAGILG